MKVRPGLDTVQIGHHELMGAVRAVVRAKTGREIHRLSEALVTDAQELGETHRHKIINLEFTLKPEGTD